MKYKGFYDKDQSIVPQTTAHNKTAMDVSMVIGTKGYAPVDEMGNPMKFRVIRSNRVDPRAGNVKYCAIQDISHSSKMEWWFFHISNCVCKEGQIIKSGDLLFKSGNTGVSQGPHTEHQLRVGSTKLNPFNYTVIKQAKPRNFVVGKAKVVVSAPEVIPPPVEATVVIPETVYQSLLKKELDDAKAIEALSNLLTLCKNEREELNQTVINIQQVRDTYIKDLERVSAMLKVKYEHGIDWDLQKYKYEGAIALLRNNTVKDLTIKELWDGILNKLINGRNA